MLPACRLSPQTWCMFCYMHRFLDFSSISSAVLCFAVKEFKTFLDDWKFIGPSFKLVAKQAERRLQYTLSNASSRSEWRNDALFQTLLKAKYYPELQESDCPPCMVTGNFLPYSCLVMQLHLRAQYEISRAISIHRKDLVRLFLGDSWPRYDLMLLST